MKSLFRILGITVAVLLLLAVVADVCGRGWQALSGHSLLFVIAAFGYAIIFLMYAIRKR